MSLPISPIRAVPLPDLGASGAGVAASGSGDFKSLLTHAIGGVERLRATRVKPWSAFWPGMAEKCIR